MNKAPNMFADLTAAEIQSRIDALTAKIVAVAPAARESRAYYTLAGKRIAK